ncbi:hypothetical protein COB55_03910 [Candidatus Wolfebacteria bacterium]|nr:MAG: hypothetical protein COB55_03910 [Candidatus Wolfebacteria bacterium]
MTEEFKKDLKEYLDKSSWVNINDPLILYNEYISRSYFLHSKRGEGGRLRDKWILEQEYEKYDKYLLNYLSPILNKHNIKEISVGHIRKYESLNWSIDTIRSI